MRRYKYTIHLTIGMYIPTLKQAKKVVVLLIGGTLLLFGISLIVLPGPAFIVIPLALVILATEFIWAKNLLKKMKEKAGQLRK